uniref:Uncharacterized protein n=1 Tax=Haptolina ericina TaxID=156174 RepID=A0A7S3AMF9_9EUKA
MNFTASVGVWLGGPLCSALPQFKVDATVEPGVTPGAGECKTVIMLSDLNATSTGGPMVVNGTVVAAKSALHASGGGLIVLNGAQFVGSVAIDSTDADAHLSNTMALQCAGMEDLTNLTDAIEGNPDCLPSSIEAQRFACSPYTSTANYTAVKDIDLVCNPDPIALAFTSASAKLSAALVFASSVHAVSYSGDLGVTLIVVLPPTNASADPAIHLESHLGKLALNDVIGSPKIADSLHVNLTSFAGGIHAILDSGAFSGLYEVESEVGSYGKVGIVIDDTPTSLTSGQLGGGDALVHVSHNYGQVLLEMSTKAPSAFVASSGELSTPAPSAMGASPWLLPRSAPRAL